MTENTSQHQAVVGFIENRLPQYHPAFAAPPIHHDSITQQYLPYTQVLRPSLSMGFSPRPAVTDTRVMNFWEAIFPASMVRFTSDTPEPKGRTGTTHSIRDKDNWEAIYDVLNSARAQYQNEGGAVGWLRKVRRKAADNIAPIAATAKTASKLTPNDILSTPVVGAVEVVLDVRTKKYSAPP